MKKIAAILSLSVLILTSCEKSNNAPAPAQPATGNETISVEYRIHASSGQFTYEFTQPDANGKSEVVSGDVTKAEKSFFITWTKNQVLSVKAKNIDPSSSEVTVEIYANGKFVAGGNANNANAWASAEGTVK